MYIKIDLLNRANSYFVKIQMEIIEIHRILRIYIFCDISYSPYSACLSLIKWWSSISVVHLLYIFCSFWSHLNHKREFISYSEWFLEMDRLCFSHFAYYISHFRIRLLKLIRTHKYFACICQFCFLDIRHIKIKNFQKN